MRRPREAEVRGPEGGSPWRRTWKEPGLPLLVSSTLQALGIQFFLPIFPLYLARRGLPTELVGLTIAAGLAGFGGAQFPSGLLADRIDRRTIVISGSLVYGACFLVYLLPLPALWFPIVRFLHASSGGFCTPAALAMLADLTPTDRRARMYGLWQSSWQSGLLVGPLIGGIAAGMDLRAVFLASSSICLLSVIPLLRLPSSIPPPSPTGEQRRRVLAAPVRPLLPAIGMAVAGDYVAGAVTAVWSLLLVARGASTFQVGYSYTLFALPAVVLSAWVASRAVQRGVRLVVGGSLLACAATALLGGFISPLPLLVGFGFLLGLFSMSARPVAVYLVSRAVGAEQQGTAQSVLQTALLASQVCAAAVSGFLLSFGAGPVFLAMAAVCMISFFSVLRRPGVERSFL